MLRSRMRAAKAKREQHSKRRPQDPTPEEIAERAAEIRAEWDAEREWRARVYKPAIVEITVCRTGDTCERTNR